MPIQEIKEEKEKDEEKSKKKEKVKIDIDEIISSLAALIDRIENIEAIVEDLQVRMTAIESYLFRTREE